MRKAVSTILLIILIIPIFTFRVGIVRARTITVPDDYPTIQAAVNAASPGDSIIVRSGTYTENVKVNKDHLTMESESGANSTIVQAPNFNGDVFEVTANNVNIIGFMIRGAVTAPYSGINVKSSWTNITNNIISNNYWGIDVYSSQHNSIAGNIVSNNGNGIFISYSDFNDIINNKVFYNNASGIWLSASPNNKVENNAATNNTLEGILLQASDYNAVVGNVVSNSSQDGIRLENSTNNSIINNTATNQRVDGILLVDLSNNNTIGGNNISGSGDFGIDLTESSFNEITQNSLSNNKFNVYLMGASNNTIVDNSVTRGNWGIWVRGLTYQNTGIVVGSGDNRIYHNSFVNDVDVYPESAKQLGNAWDNGYPSGGNFWSDYQGKDLKSGSNQDQPGSDGIGDTPYIIDANNRDRYPLINKPLTLGFSVKASPTLLTIQQGNSDVSTLTIASINSFSWPVQLTLTGAPSGVTATLNPEKVTPPADSSTASNLTLSVSTTATLGNFTLTVTGTNGTITHSVDINLEITPLSSECTFAIITDLHVGRGYPEYHGEEYYLTERLRNTVKWIKDYADYYNIKFVVVLGDISDSGELLELEKAKVILDALNDVGVPYVPVIGNHDVWTYTDSQEWQDLKYFETVFKPQFERLANDQSFSLRKQPNPDPQDLQNYAFSYDRMQFCILDCNSRDSLTGHGDAPSAVLYAATKKWLTDCLNEGKQTIILSHHPFLQSLLYAFSPGTYFHETGAYVPGDFDEIKDIIESHKVNALANFAGHIHGYYDPNEGFIPIKNPVYMDADIDYSDSGLDLPIGVSSGTPCGIPVVTTEALMVASNEPVPKDVKGVVRIVRIEGEEVNYSTVDGEFQALNPYLKAKTELVDKRKVDFEAYAFTTRFTSDRPLRFILDYGDNSTLEEIDSYETKLVEFNHTYDLGAETTKTYEAKLSVLGYTSDGMEYITQKVTLTNAAPLCFIFTAVLGTQAVQDLKYMRLFRDNVLMLTPVGHAFVDVYYMASPPIAEVLSHNEFLRIATRTFFVMPALYFSEAIFSPFSPLLLLALVPTTLLLHKKRKITIFLSVLEQGMLISGSIVSLVFILGILANTWPVCAVVAAILLPTVLPLACVPFARKLFGK